MEQAENPSSSRGYYCHNCNNTISLPITNFLCPDCHQGFIEKLPDGPASAASFSERNGDSRDDMDSDPLVLNRVFDDISNNLGLEVIMGGGESNARNDNRASSSSRRDPASNPSRPNERRRNRNQYTGTFEQMLGEFLNNMSRTAQNFDGNGPVLLVGNPGDYAWGREGLDTIVTQLLNQMDSSGPPPLAKDKINELPFVSITAQQVSENIQCSVCWDSFKMTEKVRQLPCDHIYHDLCIVPWLELHGTCPICRKMLSEDNEARLGFPHTGGLEALLSDVHRLSILQRTYTPSTTNSRYSHIQCFRCRNYGHFARDCPQRLRNRASVHGGSTTGRTNRSFSTQRQSSSHAVPTHDFLEEFDLDDFLTDSDGDYGSDFENLCDMTECEVCGLSVAEHSDLPCGSSDVVIDGWNTVSPSAGSSNSANFAGFGRTRRNKNITCWKCNKRGHISRQCPEKNRCGHCSKNHKTSDCWHAPNGRAASSDWDEPNTQCTSEQTPSPPFSRLNRNYESRRDRGRIPSRDRMKFNQRQKPESATNSSWKRDFESTRNQQDSERMSSRLPQWSRPYTNYERSRLESWNNWNNQRNSDGSGPSTSRYPQTHGHEHYRCFQCDDIGHIARNCPNEKRSRREGKLCRSCGREGHFSRDCPFDEL